VEAKQPDWYNLSSTELEQLRLKERDEQINKFLLLYFGSGLVNFVDAEQKIE
jgi:hypothetical protein